MDQRKPGGRRNNRFRAEWGPQSGHRAQLVRRMDHQRLAVAEKAEIR
jgi:hypothetical protein